MIVGDAASVRETLPYLLDGQQEDVVKTETRFAKPTGYGMLFSNQPGTGKTFTGLGVIKRFAMQGKTNTLIIVPSDKIIADWIRSGQALGLPISKLDDTGSSGAGIVVTTYANFGSNKTLADREWDLVVPDEAHYLSQEKTGRETTYLQTLRAITLHPDGAYDRTRMIHRVLAGKIDAINEELEAISAADQAYSHKRERTEDDIKAYRERQARTRVLEAEVKPLNVEFQRHLEDVKADVASRQEEKRPRAMFLSATPFAYEKSVDWANGFLFDYLDGQKEKTAGYNGPTPQQRFMITHFGYRMRYGKLTEPDSKVDRGLMQRQFNGWLRKQGAMSTRMLDVPHDYDRRFILVDSGIGTRIDRALTWISERGNEHAQAKKNAPNGYRLLGARINDVFDYLSRRYLLEAIKAQAAVEHVREHLAMGRKVVVFHDYKKGGGFNPFRIEAVKIGEEADESTVATVSAFNQALAEFNAEFSDLVEAPLEKMPSPIETFRQQLPQTLIFNGDVPAKDRRRRVEQFQDDGTGPQVILVQSAAGKEGISLHDVSGKHQRVLLNLGQPTQPTTAIQQEGRTYRVGQASNAIFRYFNTGTNWERWAFATTIANRASAAENLALGEQARALKDGFIAAFEESDDYRAGHEGEGTGGKEKDRAANEALTQFDRAKAFYFGTEKKTAKTKAAEGKDYFATPEPVGLKMVEWANARGGERLLEPSGGHGAIARWFPENTTNTAIEPSNVLVSRMAMVFGGKIIEDTFENHHVVNKYDAIVMNPPFGVGGKTAIEHLEKAHTHLADGGRIVALIPTGPAADKRFDEWFYGERQRPINPLTTHNKLGAIHKGDTVKTNLAWAPAGVVVGAERSPYNTYNLRIQIGGVVQLIDVANVTDVSATGKRMETFKPADGLHLVAEIKLPSATFQRAATGVMTRVVVLEKTNAPPPAVKRDLTSADDIGTLFNRIEDMSVPARAKPVTEDDTERVTVDDVAPAAQPKPVARAAASAPAPVAAALPPDTGGLPLVEHITKGGKGKLLKGVVRMDLTEDQAMAIDEFTFKKNGGWFIREKHLPRLQAPATAPEPAPALAPEPAAAPPAPAPATATTPEAWWNNASQAERKKMLSDVGRPELANSFAPLPWDKLSINNQLRISDKMGAPRQAPPPKPVTPQIPPAAPAATAQARENKLWAEQLEKLAEYFTPGRIVEGYGGHDEVLEFQRGANGQWSVRVHRVRLLNGQWLRVGRPQDERWHRTLPSAAEFVRGKKAPVLPYAAGASVPYTERRGDGLPHPGAPDRGTAPASEQAAGGLPADTRRWSPLAYKLPAMAEAKTAAQWLAANAGTEFVRDLATRLAPALDDSVPVVFLEPGKSYDMPRTTAALIRSGTLAVSRVEVADGTGNGSVFVRADAASEEILVHELLHQATQRALYLPRAAAINNDLTAIRRRLRAELGARADDTRLPAEERETARWLAGAIVDNDELLAYGLTSPTFREWAQNMTEAGTFKGPREWQAASWTERDAERVHPDPQPLTLWQRFVDAVRALLGLDRKHQARLQQLLESAAAARRAFITENTPPSLYQRLDEALDALMAIQRTSTKADFINAVRPDLVNGVANEKRMAGPPQPPSPPPGGQPPAAPKPAPKPPADPVLASAMRKAGMPVAVPFAQRMRDTMDRAVAMLRDRNGMKTAATAIAEEFRQGALDQFYGIRRRPELSGLPPEQDPVVTVRLANGGASAVMHGLLLHGRARWAANGQHLEKIPDSKGLLEILAPLGDDLNPFFGWMIGNRAARLMREGRENNFTPEEIQKLQSLGKGKEALFKQVASDYTEFKRSVLDIAEAAGLIDPEARRVWDQADYIPFYREIDNASVFSATGRRGLSGQSSGIRTLRGGTAVLGDPMENLLMNFSRLIDASLKNNALRKTIAGLGDAADVKRIGYDVKRDIVPLTEVKRVLRDQGVPDAVMATIDPSVFTGMAKMWAIQPPQEPDVVRVMVGGRPQFYKIGDPMLLRSLTSFVPIDFPGLAAMRAFKRVLTATVTMTPEFMARNLIRDSVAAQMITRDGFSPAATLRGIVKSYTETGAGEAMLFAGASFQSGHINAGDPEGSANNMRRALRAKGMSAASVEGFLGTIVDKGFAGWEKYRALGDALENANREAVYEAALRAGKSATAAAFEAKDLMDFSLRGSWAAYQILADVVPFLNARVQGMYRLGRSDPKRLLRYGMIMTMLSLALAAANDGEEWYEELPDWDKDTYWHVMVKGQHFRIPKPFELGVVFATVPERIGRYVKGLDSGKKLGRRAWKNIEDQLAIDPVPQALRPALNVGMNWDSFRDAPIETPADEGKLPSERASERTSAAAKALVGLAPGVADAAGISPKQIEYLVGGYLGTAGLYALGVADMGVRAYQGGPPRAALRADDIPVVRAFYRVDPARATVFESDLYRLRGDLEKVYNSIRARRRQGDEAGAQAIAERFPEEVQAIGIVQGATKRLGATSREMDRVQRDPDLTPAEKRERLDDLQRNKNLAARQAMETPEVRALR